MSRASRRARVWSRCWRPTDDLPGIPMMKWHAPRSTIKRREREQRQSGWYGRRDSWHWARSGRLTRDVHPLSVRYLHRRSRS